MNNYIVYKHTNLINGKIYIGITKYGDNPNLRWRNGLGYQQNSKFFEDILQFGWSNFSHDILMSQLNEIDALKWETYFIKLYDSVETGYNNNYGGSTPSSEGLQSIKTALTGLKRAPESIQKQMKTKQIRYGNGKGKNYQRVTRKIKCNETGDVFLSIAEASRWCGSTKVGECCNGHRNKAGKHPITQEPLSWSYADDNASVTIFCDELTGTKKYTINKIQCVETCEIYENATEASKATGISACNILRVCKGERKTAGKKHWIYYKEE